MGDSAAKERDRITADDMHLIQPPGSSPPSLVAHRFNGVIDGSLSDNVRIEGARAATVGSTATNTPAHLPQGGSFVNPPLNRGTIASGSSSVFINGRAAARNGDTAQTCSDVPGPPGGKVEAQSSVKIG